MGDAIKTFQRSVIDWWHHAPLLMAANILWLLLSATLILLPVATAALYILTNRIVYQQKPRLTDVITGVRGYLWVSIRWAVVTLAAAAVIYSLWAGWLPLGPQACLLLFSLLWFSFQLVLWPFLLEQPTKRLHLAVYHTILFGIGAPRFLIGLTVLTIPLLLVSLWLRVPLILFTISFMALLSSHAVHDQLATYGWDLEL
jgi:hypothetical protein